MADTKQLGVFWGDNALYFSETAETDPEKLFHVPYHQGSQVEQKKSFLSPWEIALATSIKNALSEHGVTAIRANLSLPTKDIIFRSFVIPWMPQHEIKNVVEFEVGKYIPFALEELSFSFHSVPIMDKDLKQFRIIFIAIRRDALENYRRILRAGSLQTNVTEPAAFSIIRALSFKNLIPMDETVALVEKEDVGQVIIVNKRIPQFVREFHLSTAAAGQTEKTVDEAFKRLSKEVRISLDYFNRLNDNLNVQKIFLLVSSGEEETSDHLEKYLGIPVEAIDGQTVLSGASPSTAGVGTLHAYGSSIIASAPLPVTMDLSKHMAEKGSKPKKIIPKKPINVKSLIKTALVCVPLIILSVIASMLITQNLNKKITTLNQKLGMFQDSDASFIEQKEKLLNSKLTQFKNVRAHSNAVTFLLLIPDLLPNGTWLSDLEIEYDDSAMFAVPESDNKGRGRQRNLNAAETKAIPGIMITMEGYAFSENTNRQFRLINMFLQQLKNSEEFSSFFQEIDLETTSAQKLNEHNVTSFKIVCKQTNESKRSK